MAATTTAGSVREALASAADALGAAGVEQPRLDAELLLAEATGWDRARLAAEPEAGVPPAPARAFGRMLRRRLRREPVAYILGRKGFRRIELVVDRRALIPRPETELLVEVALELRPASLLEIGAGCGAVALAVAEELPGCAVTATDTSPAALALAAENVARLDLAERVELLPGSVPEHRDFELVLANLPYVREDELGSLAPEIREWEPLEALLAGHDGLDAMRAVAPQVRAPRLALEVGAGQAVAAASLLRESGFEQIQTRRDLGGIERVLVGRRRGPDSVR